MEKAGVKPISDVSGLEFIGDWDNPRTKALISPGFLDKWPEKFEEFLVANNIAGLKAVRDDKKMAEMAHGIELATNDLAVADNVLLNNYEELPTIDIGFSLGGALLSRFRTVSDTEVFAKIWVSTVIDAKPSWDRSFKVFIRRGFLESGHETNRVYLDLVKDTIMEVPEKNPVLAVLERRDRKKQRAVICDYDSLNPNVKLIDGVEMDHADWVYSVEVESKKFIFENIR